MERCDGAALRGRQDDFVFGCSVSSCVPFLLQESEFLRCGRPFSAVFREGPFSLASALCAPSDSHASLWDYVSMVATFETLQSGKFRKRLRFCVVVDTLSTTHSRSYA